MKNSAFNDPQYQELTRLVRSEKCIVFIGSGLSLGQYPGWESLISKLCDACGVQIPSEGADADTLMKKADEAHDKDSTAYCNFLGQIFGNRIVNTHVGYDRLMRLPFMSYVTTNFDPLLANESRKPEHKCEGVYFYPTLKGPDIEKRRMFYIHGYIEETTIPASDQLVLGSRAFAKAYSESSLLPGFLTHLLTFYPVLFIGCGLREPQIKKVLDICYKLRKQIEGRHSVSTPPRFILSPMKYLVSDGSADSGSPRRDLQAETAEDSRFQELGINVVRYEPRDQRHSGIMEILDEWSNLAPVKTLSGFEGANLP